MWMKLAMVSIFGFSASTAAAQSDVSCACAAQLDALVAATQSNYSGFQDKTTGPADSIAYDAHVSVLRRRAMRSMGDDCRDILESYIAFFRDGHLSVRFTTAPTVAPASFHAAARTASGSAVATDDPILGIWESTSGRTRIEIVAAREPHGHIDRQAHVIASVDTSWHPGDVYATFVRDTAKGIYHGTWLIRGQPQAWSGVIIDDTLLLSGFNGWHRVTDAAQSPSAVRTDPLLPTMRRLAPDVGLLTLPSMQVQYAAAVDSIVRTFVNDELELLIIDVRGNQGGGDGTYMPLLPLLYTDTIVTPPGSVLSSPAVIRYYEQFLDPDGVNSPAWVVEMLRSMQERPGAHIALPASTIAYDRVTAYPRHVAILTDAVGASSTETFLLKARQSTKVRTFGQPTAGIVDYLNPAQHELSCELVLQAPTIRRSVLLPADGIDNRGILPDVHIPVAERNPIGVILSSYGRPVPPENNHVRP